MEDSSTFNRDRKVGIEKCLFNMEHVDFEIYEIS